MRASTPVLIENEWEADASLRCSGPALLVREVTKNPMVTLTEFQRCSVKRLLAKAVNTIKQTFSTLSLWGFVCKMLRDKMQ